MDASTCSWLAGVVQNCTPWEGAKLKLVKETDLTKTVRALAWIPGPAAQPDKILRRLKVQNRKIPLGSWRVVNTKADPKGQQVVFAMDESSWKVLKETLGSKLYFQWSTLNFRLLGRGAKGEVETEQMDTAEAGPSTSEQGGGDETGQAVGSPQSTGTASTITDSLELSLVDLLRVPSSEEDTAAGQD